MSIHAAFVTGAASGIGAALVRALARRGLEVHAADRSDEGLDRLLGELAAEGLSAKKVILDVTSASDFATALAPLSGRLAYLYNNAGIGLAGEHQHVGLDDFRRVIEVNVLGVAHGIAAAYPLMIAQGFGHIVNTASGAGLAPRPGMAVYAASKHAVIGLSTSLRAEAAAYGVKVSAACPGYVKTNVMTSGKFAGVDREKLEAAIPIAPMSADDCARAMIRGVDRNRAIIPISFYVRLDWWLYRMFPALAIWAGRFRAAQFRKSR